MSTTHGSVSTSIGDKRRQNDDVYNVETQCCMCFDDHEEGEEWVRCTCMRWLHEDRVIDIVEEIAMAFLGCPHTV